jgi:hypothetical protein
MAEYRVTCINKDDRYNPYERIQSIGIATAQGEKRFSQPQIIRFIEVDGHSFYVEAGGKRAYLDVAISPFGNKYVKTRADGKEPNNLLSLMECVA